MGIPQDGGKSMLLHEAMCFQKHVIFFLEGRQAAKLKDSPFGNGNHSNHQCTSFFQPASMQDTLQIDRLQISIDIVVDYKLSQCN